MKRGNSGQEGNILGFGPSGLFLPFMLSLIADAIGSYFFHTCLWRVCVDWLRAVGWGSVACRGHCWRVRLVRGRRDRLIGHVFILCVCAAIELKQEGLRMVLRSECGIIISKLSLDFFAWIDLNVGLSALAQFGVPTMSCKGVG